MITTPKWDPTSSEAWAQILGLVHVPMFGEPNPKIAGEHSVLLDGNPASFALSITDDASFSLQDEPISWSWSSNLRHAVIYNSASKEIYLRRWDSINEFRRFQVEELKPVDVNALLKILSTSQKPKNIDVISFILHAFRQIRNSFPGDALNAIRVLNSLLMGYEAVRSGHGEIDEKKWNTLKKVKDIFKAISPDKKDLIDSLSGAEDYDISSFTSIFIDNFPFPSGYHFEPELLLRHAASQLYQEAHIRIEFEQLSLSGFGPNQKPSGCLKRDVRYTPQNLARAIVQQALAGFGNNLKAIKSLTILDPACGSGIFLQEAFRELVNKGFEGRLILKGFDSSEIACSIARFCLNRAKLESETKLLNVSIDIRYGDSLIESWDSPDIILMNPPFISYERLDNHTKSLTQGILQDLARYRYDISMAFIWKGIQELKPGGVLASVLAAPLFESESGYKWREAIVGKTELLLLGRFENVNYFDNALVEPGFIVLRVKDSKNPPNDAVKIVLSKKNYFDEALRSLRQYQTTTVNEKFEIYQANPNLIIPSSWTPRSQEIVKTIEAFSIAKMTRVQDMFKVHEGIRTGKNKVFILDNNEYKILPTQEQKYFRPAIANIALQNSRLYLTEYVFYPYDTNGLTIRSEEQLAKELPTYFKNNLEPHREVLAKRYNKSAADWWSLSAPRSWHEFGKAKIVSTSFGGAGYFAYDDKGEYAVVQGYAWIWKNLKEIPSLNGDDDMDSTIFPFEDSPLPWAYLALLNSHYFEKILECFCPKVQGGQFNLGNQFIKNVFLPDLSDETRIQKHIVYELAKLGKMIYEQDIIEEDRLNDLVKIVYGYEGGDYNG
ncbi:MAG: N-6 DNA methylase [bacterium]|nr:N-6 DNA methylase [bacterium]